MSARKRAAKQPTRATPKKPKRATPKKPVRGVGPSAFMAHGHRIAVKESARAVLITIDGQTIPGATKIASGEYHSLFLPFRGYPAAKALARGPGAQGGSTLRVTEEE